MGTEARADEREARRRIDLPRGRALVVRPVAPSDVDGLADLYGALDFDDSYTRFFHAYHPPRSFFERLAGIVEGGGYGLVAVVTGDGDEAAGRIVGEASYVGLPDGDGELAMVLAREWRGWLGPYLLDALLEAAAARGVPNLQADVLVENTAMRALIRARGCVTADHPDATVTRFLIGTAGRVPTWPGPHDRPRVLVEVPGGRWHAEEAARAAGLQVVACAGPSAPGARCPVLAGGSCPLASGADAIVVAHAPDDERWRALLEGHDRVHAGVPVCVEVAPAPAEPGGRLPVPGPDAADAAAFVAGVARAHAADMARRPGAGRREHADAGPPDGVAADPLPTSSPS